jgi:vacuolar-type H+-ATPase subunit I/STV1
MASITKMLQGVSESLDGADVPDDAKEALNNALGEVKKIIAERDEYKDKIRSSEGGVSAEEAARLKRENDNLKAQVEELQGTIEQEQRKAEKLDVQRKEVEAKHQELQGQIEKDAKSRYLGDMLAGLGIESDAIPDERDLLMLRHEVELVRDDNGNVTGYKVDGEEPDEFSKKLRETPRIRRVIPNGNTGGGAGSTGGSGSGTKKPDEYTEQERVELYKNDPDEFRKLFGGN